MEAYNIPALLFGVLLIFLVLENGKNSHFLHASPAANSDSAPQGGNSSEDVVIDAEEDENCTLDLPSIAEQEREQEDTDEGVSCVKIGKEVGDIWSNETNPGVTQFCECVKMSPSRSTVQCVEIYGEIGMTDMTCQVTKEEGIVYGPGMAIPSLNMQFNCTCSCLDPETNVNKEPCTINCHWIKGCLDDGKVIKVGEENSSGCKCNNYGQFDCNPNNN